jgi:soluble lytic murein transglycosylase
VEVRNPAFPDLSVPAERPVELGPKYDLASFAPYFEEEPLAAAKAAFDKGAFSQARLLLADAGDALPVRYLRALAAVRAGDHQSAAPQMAALADDYPAMRDRCLWHAGAAYEGLRQFERAAELLAQVPADSRMYAEARLALFRSLRGMGDHQGARAALEPLARLSSPSWGRNMGADALAALAEHARSRKDVAAETEYLQRLWAFHPFSAHARAAEKRLDLKKMPTLREVDRAETLVDAHRNQEGIGRLEPLTRKLQLPDPLACRAHFVLGKALRKEREHRRAIEVLTPVVAQCHDSSLRPRALYVLASSRSIATRDFGAGIYETLANDYPDHSFADDALYYAAALYIANDDLDSALARLSELATRYPNGDYTAEALFKSFWLRRARGELDQARALLDKLETTFARAAESYERERAQYWRARLSEGEGRTKEAVEAYARLAVNHPGTYYGLISRRRLGTLDEQRQREVLTQLYFPPAESPWPLHAGPLAADPHFLAAVELLRMGFREAVASELLAADRTRLPQQSVRLLVQLLAHVGETRAAHAVARLSLRGDLSGRITARTRSVWEVAYPLAFRDLVEKHTAPAAVDPDLLQALMREESALDPRARSWAGALGLTQLMPATARAVAGRLKLANITPARLLDPDLNLRLGSAYLGELLKRFDGVEELALAGYNAGGGAPAKWRRERPHLELDEWVEEIPISETRGYVKRVLRSYNTYQLLYRKPSVVPLSRADVR